MAGSTLASFLGRAGLRVLLVDASHFPSDTTSTHFFRGGGFLEILRRAGALETVLKLGAPRLTQTYLYTNGSRTPQAGPPQNPGTVGFDLSVRRVTLDSALVAHALTSGNVTVATGTRAMDPVWDDGKLVGLKLGSKERVETVRAALTVGADGRTSWLARNVGATLQAYEPGHRGMYYAYFAGLSSPIEGAFGAEFSVNGDEIAYVFPSDGEVACVAVSVNLQNFRRFQSRPGQCFLAQLREHHPGIGDRILAAHQVGRLKGVGPAPNFVRLPFGPTWALVGDSEMHQDPFSGQGIDAAGIHAALLAAEILRWHHGECTWAEAGRVYTERRDANSLATYEQTVLASRNLAGA